MRAILWDLNGTLVHNNKSLGTGDLPEGYGSDDSDAAVKAFRDGVMPRAYYLTSKKDIVWIDGALEAIKLLSAAGFDQFIITNQEHIGLGIIMERTWTDLVSFMTAEIRNAGGGIRRWYYCPHKSSEGCLCRKRTSNPGLKLFYQCALDYGFNLYDAYMIGDNISDMSSGKLAGCKTIMVKTPVRYDPLLIEKYVDYVVDSSLTAVELILERFPKRLKEGVIF